MSHPRKYLYSGVVRIDKFNIEFGVNETNNIDVFE